MFGVTIKIAVQISEVNVAERAKLFISTVEAVLCL